MYFSIKPKEREEDFFNYKEELNRLRELSKKVPLTAVMGPRRVGKTSLINVVYNEWKGPKAWINLLSPPDKNQFFQLLYNKLRYLIYQSSPPEKIRTLLEEFETEKLKVKKRSFWALVEILERNKIKGLLVIDEAQQVVHWQLDRLLAHFYDRLALNIVIAGSQIGVLEELLKKEPLKGRLIEKITLAPLSEQKAMAFLLEGFSQYQKNISSSELEEVVKQLGTLTGWLTYYGHYRLSLPHQKALEEVKEVALEILIEELTHLKDDFDIALHIFLAISKGFSTWAKIKRFVEVYHQPLSDSTFQRILKKLISLGWLEHRGEQYLLTDPLTVKVAERFLE